MAVARVAVEIVVAETEIVTVEAHLMVVSTVTVDVVDLHLGWKLVCVGAGARTLAALARGVAGLARVVADQVSDRS